jgi:hypothetical protein
VPRGPEASSGSCSSSMPRCRLLPGSRGVQQPRHRRCSGQPSLSRSDRASFAPTDRRRREELLRLVAPLPRDRKRYRRIWPERKHLLLAAEAVLQPPQLCAARLHGNVEAAAVWELVWLLLWLGRPHGEIGQHWGYSLRIARLMPPNIPQRQREAKKMHATVCLHLRPKMWDFLVRMRCYVTRRYNLLVPRRGLEPPRLAPLVPETSASTNSATWASAQR